MYLARIRSFSGVKFNMSSQVSFLRKPSTTFRAFKWPIPGMYSFMAYLWVKNIQ